MLSFSYQQHIISDSTAQNKFHGMLRVGQLHVRFKGEDGFIWVSILISSADQILTSQLQNTTLDFLTSVGGYVSFILISTAQNKSLTSVGG